MISRSLRNPSAMRSQNGPYYIRQGLTLVEVIFALMIMAMAFSAVAMTIKAAADAWQAQVGIQETNDTGLAVTSRLRTIVNSAHLVGFQNSDRLVLWANDHNGNFLIDYDECVLLQHDGEELLLYDIYFPPGTPQGNIDARRYRVVLDDFVRDDVAKLLEEDAYGRVRVLGQYLDRFEISMTEEAPYGRTVVFAFRFKNPEESEWFHAVISLGNPVYYPLQ